jgi:hypothetical protein
VLLTFDASETVLRHRFWLPRDYLPEFAGLFTGWPSLAGLADAAGARRLGGPAGPPARR